jgi:hypothetical protein
MWFLCIIFCIDQDMLLQPEELIEETCLMQDAKDMRSKMDMASRWQCRPRVNHHHEVVQTKTMIIGAQISSSSSISIALSLLTFQTLL